jgi:hypothetical protein
MINFTIFIKLIDKIFKFDFDLELIKIKIKILMNFVESARNVLSNPDRFKAFLKKNKKDIIQWV